MPEGALDLDKEKSHLLSAERYKIQSDYKRFDQKKHMYYQGEWNPKYAHLSRVNKFKSLYERLKGSRKNYNVLDYAFYLGASANRKANNFIINRANYGGTSWEGIQSKIKAAGLELPQWRGDARYASNIIKKAARIFGADDVGICLLDRRWVYSHYYDVKEKRSYPIRFNNEEGYTGFLRPGIARDRSQVIPASMKYVIVLIHKMDYTGIATAPYLVHMAITDLAYSRISFTLIAVAEFLRGLGYNAIPSANCTAINIPLAIDAGLGEMGRHGMLIHPLYGPRCRISKVITDLHLKVDLPIDMGVTEFCRMCKICAQKCPSKAISSGERSYEAVGEFGSSRVFKWQSDYARCREYWVKIGTNCGICMACCTFNRPEDYRNRYDKTMSAEDFWETRY